MATHPAWWTSEETVDGLLPAGPPALTPLPPSGRLPFAAMARQPAARRRGHGQAADGDEADAAGFATCPLAGVTESPGTARRFTRATLRNWGVGELVDDASVVVSELVTNALRYGLAGAGQRPLPPATAEQPILLSLVHYGGSVLCAVFDPGTGVPRVTDPHRCQESGRGLHVLASLTESWGWTTPDRHGKAVWALLLTKEEAGNHCLPSGPADADWEPLTRLLLLLELLSGPSWLKALGSSARGPGGGPQRPGRGS